MKLKKMQLLSSPLMFLKSNSSKFLDYLLNNYCTSSIFNKTNLYLRSK